MQPTATPNRRAGKVRIPGGVSLWRDVTVTGEDYKGFDVRVRVVTDGTRIEADEVCVRRRGGGPAVTSDALRSITVAAFVRHSLKASEPLIADETLGGDVDEERFLGDVAAHGLMTFSQRDALRAAGPTAETLRMVATIYQLAYALGEAPTGAVRDSFRIAQSTAGNWIAAARAAGLLSPTTTPGKAQP